MKSIFKRIGIIVFAAVIGFSMVACNLFKGEEEEQETQTTYTQTLGGQTPGGEQPGGEQPGADPTHTHQYGEWSVTTAATCMETGVETRTCVLDPSHTETQIIPIDPDAHVLGPNSTITKQPTYTEDGIASGICTLNSSHVLDNSPISALGHDWEWIQTTTATVTTDGTETKTCRNNSSHTDGTRTLYATGTLGLAFEAIGTTAYRVRKGTVTTGAVHIPTYYRPDASSQYLPVTEIGASSDTSSAFSNPNITTITFAENSQLTSIGPYAFSGCNSLTNITIPEGVMSIGSGAFSACSSLTSITIPASVTSFGYDYGAFSICTSLTSITVAAANPSYSSDGGGILYNKAKTILIKAPPAGISGSVTIPTSVTSLGSGAFQDCIGLTSVTIPSGVTYINYNMFQFCYNLTSITVATSNSTYSSDGGIVYNKAKTSLILAPPGISGTVTIPTSVMSIGSNAFSGCRSLTDITIPTSVMSIGSYAFQSCTGLTDITIPTSVTRINSYAFSGCTGLTSITIPSSVTDIDFNAFQSWTVSQTINVPFANDSAKPSGWNNNWKGDYCNAVIKYWNGSEYQ